MTGRRAQRTKKVERIKSAGLPLYPCSQCGRTFCDEEARKNHIRAKHAAGYSPASKPVTSSPKRSTVPATVAPKAHGPATLLEVDFISAHPHHYCTECGGAGAMPLTGLCFDCDPIRVIEAEDTARFQSKGFQSKDAAPVNSQLPHSNVLALPRPGMGAPAAAIPSEHPAFSPDSGKVSQIPDFLRRNRKDQIQLPLAPTIN